MSIGTLVRVLLCAALLTTVAILGWQGNTGTPDSRTEPAEPVSLTAP